MGVRGRGGLSQAHGYYAEIGLVCGVERGRERKD